MNTDKQDDLFDELLSKELHAGPKWYDMMQERYGFLSVKEFESRHKIDNNFRAQGIDDTLSLVPLCVFAGSYKGGGVWHDAAPGKQTKTNLILIRTINNN